jgi:ParB-like chromosome segregation protein Spo0J
MHVVLKDLDPNPFRDFTIDPIDPDKVRELQESITQDGFWGGVVCRRGPKRRIQIGAGHHRVEAAMASGMRTADLFVADHLTDQAMVRVYTRENQLQRGNSGAALAGSVAAAVRVLAKIVLGGGTPDFRGTSISLPELRAHIAKREGLGSESIIALLGDVLNRNVIDQQLANLKSSGDYARIIAKVKEELEEENRVALKELAEAERKREEAERRAQEAETARKAAAAKAKAAREEAAREQAEAERRRAEAEAKLAKKREAEAEAALAKYTALRETRDLATAAASKSAERAVTFALNDVSRHLTVPSHIEVFRELVTGEALRDTLPVKSHGALAQRVVAHAKALGVKELTGAFIRDHLMDLVLNAKRGAYLMTQDQLRELRAGSLRRRVEDAEDDFARGCHLMTASGAQLRDLERDWPRKEGAFPISAEFRTAIRTAKQIIDQLARRFL